MKFDFGRMISERGTDRTGSPKHKNTPLHFLGTTMDHKVPNGWIMVMLAAFRANVDWDLQAAHFAWKVSVESLLGCVLDDLVSICVQEYRDNKVRPDEMARNHAVYDRCYKEVELYLLRERHR